MRRTAAVETGEIDVVHRKTPRANVNNLGRGHAGRQPSGKIFLEDGPHRVCHARRISSPRRVGTLTGKECVNRPLALGRNGQVVVLMGVGLGPRGGFFLAVVLTPPTRRAALLRGDDEGGPAPTRQQRERDALRHFGARGRGQPATPGQLWQRGGPTLNQDIGSASASGRPRMCANRALQDARN